jgi:hypothetical protein
MTVDDDPTKSMTEEETQEESSCTEDGAGQGETDDEALKELKKKPTRLLKALVNEVRIVLMYTDVYKDHIDFEV